MNKKKFFFDECLGAALLPKLKAIASDGSIFDHVHLKYFQGIKDEVWIPQLGAEGGWLVITTDKGRQSKSGSKLPELCLQFGVTHLLVSQGVHRKKSTEKLEAFVGLWTEIESLTDGKAGRRFHLKIKSLKGGKTHMYEIVDDESHRPKKSRKKPPGPM